VCVGHVCVDVCGVCGYVGVGVCGFLWLWVSVWGDPREFTMGDMAAGECAGEVVSLVEFDMAAAERLVFEAQLLWDDEDYSKADELAYNAMLQGAKALIKTEFLDVSDDPDTLVKEFRERFFDTKLFRDKYAGGKFAQYLFRRHQSPPSKADSDGARQLVEEAQLFIEAAHACWERVADRQASDSSLAQGAPSPTGG